MDTNLIGVNSLNTYKDANINNVLKSTHNVKNASNNKLREASDSFESFFVQQMLEISTKNLHLAGEGTGSEIIKGMYIETISRTSSGGVGISDMIYNYLKDQQQNTINNEKLKNTNQDISNIYDE